MPHKINLMMQSGLRPPKPKKLGPKLLKNLKSISFQKKTLLRSEKELRRAKVEPEGLEPSSKQGIDKLSTCLALFDCRERSVESANQTYP